MNLNNCIIFDTETNGIGCFRPPTHRLLQLAYITPDKKYTTYIKGVTKMAPDLPHNITIEKCNEEGIDSKDAILKFMEEIRKVDVIIAHNIKFDEKNIARIRGEARRDVVDEPELKYNVYKPWVNQSKKFIASIYKEEGLMEELYPITRSCVGGPNQTNNFTEWCWQCFWCYEKAWAFDLLKD